MPTLDCISILEVGSFTADPGTVDVPTGEVPFPIEPVVYSLRFVHRRNSENVCVVT